MSKDNNDDAQVNMACRPEVFGLTIGEVARGFSVSEKHITRLVQAGQFPRPFKHGSLNRWDVGEVRRWSARQSAAVNGETDPELVTSDAEMDATVSTTQGGEPVGSGSTEVPKPKRASVKRSKASPPKDLPHKPIPVQIPRGRR